MDAKVKNEGKKDAVKKTEKSLLEELEALDVVEAHELQEGAAFHAFRFR